MRRERRKAQGVRRKDRGCEMETDIAVIEEYNELTNEWVPVIWIGPDRTEGEFSITSCRLRIRYLNLFIST